MTETKYSRDLTFSAGDARTAGQLQQQQQQQKRRRVGSVSSAQRSAAGSKGLGLLSFSAAVVSGEGLARFEDLWVRRRNVGYPRVLTTKGMKKRRRGIKPRTLEREELPAQLFLQALAGHRPLNFRVVWSGGQLLSPSQSQSQGG